MHGGMPRNSDLTPMQNGGAPPQQTFGMDPRFFGQGRQGASINGLPPAFANLPPGGSPMGGEVPPGFGQDAADQQAYQSKLPAQVPPRYCCLHDERIKRVKEP